MICLQPNHLPFNAPIAFSAEGMLSNFKKTSPYIHKESQTIYIQIFFAWNLPLNLHWLWYVQQYHNVRILTWYQPQGHLPNQDQSLCKNVCKQIRKQNKQTNKKQKKIIHLLGRIKHIVQHDIACGNSGNVWFRSFGAWQLVSMSFSFSAYVWTLTGQQE